jgi:hypothetical protein
VLNWRVISVLLLCAVGAISITTVAHYTPPNETAQSSGRDDKSKNGNSNAPIPTQQPDGTPHQGSAPKETEIRDKGHTQEPDWWSRILGLISVYANLGLLLIGAVAAFIGIATLKTLTRQTEANVAAANAAYLNAQAVMKSQRAWILVEDIEREYLVPFEGQDIQQIQPSYVPFTFRNYGETIGRVIAWKFGLYITDIVDEPPAEAYDLTGLVFNPYIIPKQVEAARRVARLENGTGGDGTIRKSEMDRIISKTSYDKMLWLCGTLKYEDVFDPKIIHKTVFCYRFHKWLILREPFFRTQVDKYNQAD